MATSISHPHRLPGDVWLYAAVVCGLSGGAYIGRTGSLTPLIPLLAIGAVGVAIATPRIALAAGLAAIALPYTWGPDVPSVGFGSGLAVGLLLLIAYIPSLAAFRPSALDLAVLAFAITPAAVAGFQGQSHHVMDWIAPAITLPYFGFRLLFHTTDARRALGSSIVPIGVVVSLIAVWEELTGHNPVVAAGAITYNSAGGYVTTWNVPEFRDGHLRALSTFGHPIALGMFLLVPLAFALARGGLWNLVCAGVILTAEVFTYSRDAWIGCLIVVVLLAGRGRPRVLGAAVVLAAGAALIGPVNRLLAESSAASTEAGNNTYYRIGLLKHAFQDLTLFGHPFTDLQSAIPNYPDVTSLLAGTMIQTGVVGLVELLLITGLVLVALIDARRSPDQDYQAATAALTAQLVGLSSVALITNFQFFFWALLAYVATLRATRAHNARSSP